ncbi:MAG: carbohydrate kinase [Acidobacteriaceae bacterium]
MRILSIGEVLWDVIGGREFLGGAPLNFSVSAQRLGNEVAFVSAVGADDRGRLALQSIEAQGLSAEWIETLPGYPTGTAVASMDASGSAIFQIIRPVAYDFLSAGEAVFNQLVELRPDWIYFGTLVQTAPGNEALLHRLIAAAPSARRFYDINLREGQWSAELVQRLSALTSVLKLNEAEAETLFRLTHGLEKFSLERFCQSWSRSYGIELICVTLGERGCAVWSNNALQNFPGRPAKVMDTVGAGDAFSAAFLHGLGRGWPLEQTAGFANALGSLVASRAGATPAWTIEELCANRNGTV